MGERWQNWSGSVRAAPREVAHPGSLDELARMVGAYGQAGRHIRVVGSGHSFTPLVRTDDVLMTLDGMQGIEAMDAEYRVANPLSRSEEGGVANPASRSERDGTVRVLGGTRLKRLGDELLARGLAQENLGDIDVQSIAGAISTGTHGTGIGFGTLATQVAALTIVTASGEVVECSNERNRDVFKAAQVSLGALGVLAAVTLRVVPARRLHFQARRETLEHCLANLDRYKRENSHFEFFWFPYGKWVQAKFLNETDAPAKGSNAWGSFNKIVMENGLFWVLSEMSRLAPPLAPRISRLSGWGISNVDETDYSHRLFATPRAVRFQEMEYNIPAESFPQVLEEVQACIEKHRFRVNFPIECRFVRGDDIWLSPAYQRDSAYIAVHMYRGMEYEPYFHAIEEIYARYQGRPHWGKMHSRTAAQLAALYPRWEDFRHIRIQLDPQGVFLNDYLRGLFAADEEPHPQPLSHWDRGAAVQAGGEHE